MPWTTEEIFYEKEAYFSALLKATKKARVTIDIETYIFNFDEIGRPVLDALIAAAERGVKVRLLIDWIGSLFWVNQINSYLMGSKVDIKYYKPFRLQILLKMNRRLHRKVCIFDNESAFVGSFNITNEVTRDTTAYVMGPDVTVLTEAFEKLWESNWIFWRKKQESSLVLLNDRYKSRKAIRLKLGERIKQAEKRIWITNAYFVPPPFLLKSLYFAAKNKIDVQLITPQRSSFNFIKWISETFYSGLLIYGVRIFEYDNKTVFLHAKTIIIDDWILIGSSNLSHRSFFQNLEVDIVLQQKQSLESLEKQFVIDKMACKEITITEFKTRPLLSWLLLFLKKWI